MDDTSPAGVLETDNLQILERVEAKNTGVPLFTAHWHLFLPTLVIAVLYSALWMFFASSGKADSGLARLFIVVMAIGVPLLAVHAFLRYQTIRVQVNEDQALCHPGWPKEFPIGVPGNVIQKVRVRRGLAGRLFGGGTLILQLSTGGRIVIADLAKPRDAKLAIQQMIEMGKSQS